MRARVLSGIVAAGLVTSLGGCQYLRGLISETPAEPRPAETPTLRSSAEVIRAMRTQYDGRWYSTLSLTGQTTRWSAAGEQSRTRWNQYVSVPGRMRIEFLPWNQSGVLFEGGRVHVFDDGRRIDTRPQIHPLLLLTADVYTLPTDRTLAELRRFGVATDRFRETTWQGRRVYVLGGVRGDTSSTQAWVDAERLVLVRWIHRETRDGQPTVGDTHLRNYRNVRGIPVHHEVIGYRDNQRVLREAYSSIQVNPALSPALFDPNRWRDAPRPRR